MNKVLWIILIVFCAWLSKLSIDVYSLENQKIDALNKNIEQQNQRVASLYDQLIALQKQQNSQPLAVSKTAPATAMSSTTEEKTYSAQDYVQDRLQLIQAALQQQRFTVALEQIQHLRQQLIEKKLLSESLNLALIEALSKDQSAITLYMQQRAEHQQILQQQLLKIGRNFQADSLDQAQSKWQWSNWLSIGKADQIPDLQQRKLYFKQLQLQLLLAQQALYAGQTIFYRSQIQDMIEGLSAYPDRNARKVIESLQKLDRLALSAPPQLSALALMQAG
ncbi:MAG: hypothetical protein LKF82_09955 [Acinetobacter populi]|jgi:hypothetical protein|uniref:hypothetical protein n=1 Tax=Acinetobacter populi TaxID=1582270 RepID=UPI0023527BDB|nr:hypothetical protein [Acinetobacter populi]MCH4248132.1 hypothetical protein [Acinetobacter populi]